MASYKINFNNDKKQHLYKLEHLDKSKKGSVDKPIEKLVELINSKKDFYTTSSCSGRIVVLSVPDSGKKNKSKWLFVSHELVKYKDFEEAIESKNLVKDTTYLRCEPFIVHVVARDMGLALAFLKITKEMGLKRCGIISAKNRIVLEIIGLDWIISPIAVENKLIVGNDYLKFLVTEANNKLKKNKQKISLLYTKVLSGF